MKIGVFGGSFDPIHLGHVNLAVSLMEAHGLDEVWFLPSSKNPYPHKLETKTAPADDRCAMIRLVIDDNPKFKICDIELKRQGPSYTVDTIKELLNHPESKQHQFYLILGLDSAQLFHQWHQPEEIVHLVPLLIGARPGGDPHFRGPPEVVKALEKGMTPTRQMDISSSEIRKRVSKGEYCGHLLQRKVMDYIVEHRLYL